MTLLEPPPTGIAYEPHCLRVAVSCRNCGAVLEPLDDACSNGVTTYMPMQCTAHGCRRSYVVKAEMLAVQDHVGGGHK